MDWHARIRKALTREVDEDVLEELAQHAQAAYEQARADGVEHADAAARVHALIDRWRAESAALKHKPRRTVVPSPPTSSSSRVIGVMHDVRYACRLAARQPGFALLVIFTMALGIGATTALFSVTYGVLMKPLPWPDAGRLVVLKETRGGHAPRFGSFSNTAYLAWREQAATLDGIAAWTPQTVTMSGAGDPERIRVTAATPELFQVLGIRPLIGSVFRAAEDRAPLVILGESLWRQRFGGDPAILGRVIHFDGEPRTIVGVVSDAVAYPDRLSRAWIPYSVALPSGNFLSMFEAVAKLRPGVTVEQAAAEGSSRGRFAANTGMTTVAIFGGDGPVETAVRPLADAMTGDVRQPLIVLLAAVALLLAIATTNIASLQLARATARRRELAIRAALGATGSSVVRQLLIESVLLGIAGGVAGLLVASLLLSGAKAILPADFPRAADLGIDVNVAAFAFAASVLASVVFGLFPALHVRRIDLVASLAEDGASPVGVSARSRIARSRLLIIGGQVTIVVVLLVGASLLGRSFVALLTADRGYDPSLIVTAPLSMAGPGYTPQRRVALMREIVARLAAAPGVEHAGFSSEAPWMPGGSTSSLTLPSRTAAGSVVAVQASPRIVSPGYFGALGLRILAGRYLQASDTESSQPVVVVNETFARQYLGDDPLTATIPMAVMGHEQGGNAAVIGVVQDVRYVRAGVTTLPEMYFSYRQVPAGIRSTTTTLLLRGNGDVSRFAPAIRGSVQQIDAALVPGAIMTVQDRLLATSLARPRLYALLLAGFALAALIVTAVGLFGVLSYTVAQRTRELGLRAALGARRSDLVTLVLRQGMRVVIIGAVAGLVVSLWTARFLTTLLYGVTAHDWVTYAVVPALLIAVAAFACIVPARRAARLDPLRALRS